MRQIEGMYGKRMPPVVENMLEHCKQCDLSKLTSESYLNEALITPKHGNRAVLIIYLGYVYRNGIDQHAHWGLVVDTKVITKFRTVKTYGEYPWVA